MGKVNFPIIPMGYISIYKTARLLGLSDLPLKKDIRKRMLFQKTLEKVSINLFNKIILDDVVIIDGPAHNIVYRESDILLFLDTHMTKSQFQSQLGLVRNNMNSKIKNYKIPVIEFSKSNETKYIKKDIALIHISDHQSIVEEEYARGYISIYDVAEMLGRDLEGFKRWECKERFAKQILRIPVDFFEVKRLGRQIESNVRFPPDDRFYKKVGVEKFLENHITKAEIIRIYGINLSNYQHIPSYQIGPRINCIYVPKDYIQDVLKLPLIETEKIDQAEILIMPENETDWITSLEFAEMLKVSTDLSREFAKNYYTSLLINLSEKGIVEVSDIKIPTIYGKYKDNILVNKKSALSFIDNHMTKRQLSDLLITTRTSLNKFISDHHLSEFKLGSTIEYIFIPKKNVFDVLEPSIDLKEYVSVHFIAKYLDMDIYSTNIYRIFDRMNKLPEGIIKKIELKHPMIVQGWHTPQKTIFKKDDITNFFLNHISIQDISKKLGSTKNCIIDILKKHQLNKYEFGGQNSRVFVSIESYEVVINYISNRLDYTRPHKNIKKNFEETYYMQKDAAKLLKLNRTQFNLLVEEKGIEVIEGIFGSVRYRYYEKVIVHNLLDEQKELLIQYKDNYYSRSEMEDKFDNRINSFTNTISTYYVPTGEVETIFCPTLLLGYVRSKREKQRKGRLYLKNDVDEVFYSRMTSKLLRTTTMEKPYEEFVYKVEQVIKINFSDKLNQTKDLWYQYVSQILLNSICNEMTPIVNSFVRITEVLSVKLNKELFLYSSVEMNKLIFNNENEIPRTFQQTIYSFCKKIYSAFVQEGKVAPFYLENINNPYEYPKIVQHDITTYSFEEYQKLYTYVNNIEIHKLKAIEDVEIYLKGKNNKFYDSCWLYIIIHLTNNWRHATVVTQIQEVDLSNTSIQSLNWLKSNNPTIEDANDIIFQIGRTIKEIHKTGAESEFRIAEPLKVTFAIAISICVFRTKGLTYRKEKSIICLGNKEGSRLSYTTNYEFFKLYGEEFTFFNRKMNRTLTTLIWSVFRHLKDAKVSRSHFNESTTMHYIKLNDIQIKNLVDQLFERGTFGYFTQQLTNLLFTKETDKYFETERMKIINRDFGDVQKIEITSGLIDKISKEQTEVLSFLSGKSKNELIDIYDKSVAGALFSKKRYYQCVFSDCKFNEDKDCADCHFSIINVYALSNLMSSYLKHIKRVIDNFESAPEGERKKMSNHFYLIHSLVKNARDVFGTVIYDFVEGGRKVFKQLQENFPETKHYLTSGVLNKINILG